MKHGRPVLTLLAAALAAGSLSAQAPGQGLVDTSRSHLMGLRQSFGLDDRHSFAVRGALVDHLGQTHARMQQLYRGVRVWDAEAITHADADGRQLAPTADLRAAIDLAVNPSLGAGEALGIAHADLNPIGVYAFEPKAELVVYPEIKEVLRPGWRGAPSATDVTRQVMRYTLAYHVHAELENGAAETSHTDYLIDAHSGKILKKWSTLRTTGVTGTGNSQYSGTVALNTNLNGSTYELSDVVGNMPIKTYNLNHGTSGTGTLYTDADNTWGDGANYVSGGSTTNANGQTAGVDAHYGIMMTSAYYKNIHGRNGIDGNNTATYSRVHYSSNYDNAFWSDSCFCMTYGDGSSFKSLESLDVAGHEMSHGVCASTANLTYSGESGGLNESNSDIFGTFVVYYADNGGTGTTVPSTIPTANLHGYVPWTVGSQLSSTPLRYMYKPSKDGSSPDAWYSGMGNLDVHYSSGPMNRCMYFLSQGATTSGDTSTTYLPDGMTGIGNDHAARIWYRALSVYMTSSTNYAGARTACISAAKDLYGAASAEEKAVWNAFHGINVGAAWVDVVEATPTITTQPSNATVSAGTSATFSVVATGGNLQYQWYKNGGVISGASAASYTTPATTTSDSGATFYVTVTNSKGSVTSTTATLTVTPSLPNLILNGGFESGTVNWSGTTGDIGTWSGQPAYEGTKCAWMMGNGRKTTETLYQTVTVPSTATSAILSFYLHIDTAETTTSIAYDKFVVSLMKTNGQSLKTLATYSNLNAAAGYVKRSFDVSAYKGQTFRVYFKGTEDSSLQSSFVVDNVSLATN